MAAPTGITIQKYSRLRCRIDWTANGSDSYTIERRIGGGLWATFATGITSAFYVDGSPRQRGKTYSYRVVAVNGGSPDGTSAEVTTTVPRRLLLMFSDSSLAFGADGRSAGASCYANQLLGSGEHYRPRVQPDPMPDSPTLLSGKVATLLNEEVETVNHSQAGYYGDWGEVPVNGHLPFFGEILGVDGSKDYTVGGNEYPFNETPAWLGGVGVNRVNTQQPTDDDWLLIQYGANDLLPPQDPYALSVATIVGHLEQYIDWWVAAGLSPKRIIVSTIPPIGNSAEWDDMYQYHPSDLDGSGSSLDIRQLNNSIRALKTSKNVNILDTVDMCSNDNGLNWSDQITPVVGLGYNSPWHILNDDNHFSEALFDLMAADVTDIMTRVQTSLFSGSYGEGAEISLTSAADFPTIYYRWDDGIWQTYSEPLTIQEGTLDFYAENASGDTTAVEREEYTIVEPSESFNPSGGSGGIILTPSGESGGSIIPWQ